MGGGASNGGDSSHRLGGDETEDETDEVLVLTVLRLVVIWAPRVVHHRLAFLHNFNCDTGVCAVNGVVGHRHTSRVHHDGAQDISPSVSVLLVIGALVILNTPVLDVRFEATMMRSITTLAPDDLRLFFA